MKKCVKWAVALLTAAFLLMLTLYSLSTTVVSVALSQDTYTACFDAYADTSASGVEKAAYPALAAALAGYFKGTLGTPQVEVEKFGASAAAYEAENAHRPANTQMSFFIAPPACQSAV